MMDKESVRKAKVQAVRLLTGDDASVSVESAAEQTGLTVAQVRSALASSASVFAAQLADAKEAGALRELRRVGWVEAQAMEAWQSSPTEKAPAGDPRFLNVVLECSDRRAKLLGLIPKDKGGTSGAIDPEAAIAAVTRAIIKHLAPTQFRARTVDAAETLRIARAIEADLRASFGLVGDPVELDAADFAIGGGNAGDGES